MTSILKTLHLKYSMNFITKFNLFVFNATGNYKKFTGLKVYNKNLKTMIAIGGWNEASKR